jgi:hypothetical protein
MQKSEEFENLCANDELEDLSIKKVEDVAARRGLEADLVGDRDIGGDGVLVCRNLNSLRTCA